MNLTAPGTVRELLRRHGITADRALGQNFLVSESVLGQLVAALNPSPGDVVLEIGPGLGTLTQALAPRCAAVVGVELDRRLLPVLAETVGALSNVRLVHGDALRVDLGGLVREELDRVGPGGDCLVAANLPYYITSPLLLRFMGGGVPWRRMVVMVQREVAGRLVAAPGGKDYGALTLAVRYHAEARVVSRIPQSVFFPRPEVESAIVVLERRAEPPVDVPLDPLVSVVRAAFGQRRKTLLNALAGAAGIPFGKGELSRALLAAGIDPGRRGETLSLEEFACVARSLLALGWTPLAGADGT